MAQLIIPRLSKSKQATADSAGNLSVTLDAPPPDRVYTGNLSIPTAPPGAVFRATLGGINLGGWAGPQGFGPVQAYSSESVVITGNGLVPGATYDVVWLGRIDEPELAIPQFPSARTSPSGESSGQAVLTVPAGTVIAAPYAMYGPYDVSNYKSLILRGFSPLANNSGFELSLAWSDNQNMSPIIATTFFETRRGTTVPSPQIRDAIPVLARWVRVVLTPSAGAVTTSGASTLTPSTADLRQHCDIPGIFSLSRIFQEVVAAGATTSARLDYVTSGPWQFMVYVGAAFGAGGALGVPWTLEVDEEFYTGIEAAIALVSHDPGAAEPASKSAVVYLSQATARLYLTNRSGAAQTFTVQAIPVPA